MSFAECITTSADGSGGGGVGLQFTSFELLLAELASQNVEGLEATLYKIGFIGDSSMAIGTWRWLTFLGGFPAQHVLVGELHLENVTDSRFGEQDASSPSTGNTRIMTAGHNLPTAGTLSIRASDGVGGVLLATSVAYTRVGDTLTFTAGDPVPGGTSTDDQFFEDGGEFGHLEGRLIVEPGALGYFSGGLMAEQGPVILEDVGLVLRDNELTICSFIALCDTTTSLSQTSALQVVGYGARTSGIYAGGARKQGLVWRRGVAFGTDRTSPSGVDFGSATDLAGDTNYTDVSMGCNTIKNETLGVARTGAIFSNDQTTDVVLSEISIGEVNIMPTNGDLIVGAYPFPLTSTNTVKVKRCKFLAGGHA
jgi:hypothetical protein